MSAISILAKSSPGDYDYLVFYFAAWGALIIGAVAHAILGAWYVWRISHDDPSPPTDDSGRR
jgi:hypothetical protein